MLRSVLGAYLDQIGERDLDLPLLSLLAAMNFYDIHYTHGSAEFGKDFIAKKIDSDGEIQYSFQSKAGDINQSTWRNNIQGQLLESILIPMVHPNFNEQLPHQAVLITTGDLRGNAGIAMQSLNDQIENTFERRKLIFWGRENLIDLFEQYGLTSMLQVSPDGLISYANFFLIYANGLRGKLSHQEIELYSRQWLAEGLQERQLFRSAIEAELISHQCLVNGHYFEAIFSIMAMLRTALASVYPNGGNDNLTEMYRGGIKRLKGLCLTYVEEVRRRWSEKRDLLAITEESASIVTYPIQCSRVIEIICLLYFISDDLEFRSDLASFLEDFIQTEPGCVHPVGDRYAVSIVLAVILLCNERHHVVARDVLRNTTIWLCDRKDLGAGLASFEADEMAETATLVGFPFEAIDVKPSQDSFLASALCDLAAFLGDAELYRDIVNDIRASSIFPEYWQPSDSVSACRIDSKDIISYPNIEYNEEITPFLEYRYGDHIVHEPKTFLIAEELDSTVLVILMLFLRDRYFPTYWSQLAPGHFS
jgi:hypothetical protein